MHEHPRPLSSPGARARALPFLVLALTAFAVVPLPPRATSSWQLTAAGAVMVSLILAAAYVPWHRLAAAWQAVPPLAFFVVVALLRDAEGGAVSAVSTLALAPVLWLALHGTRRELGVAIALATATFAVPPVLIGPPRYPDTELESTILAAATALIIGAYVHQLVTRARAHARHEGDAARTDELTGLPNRRSWEETLERELARARRESVPLSVALLDLDRFKAFNDELGHQAGDALLAAASAAWQRELRAGDFLARYGGEEFAALFVHAEVDEALPVVERLRAVTPGGQTCSAGLVGWTGTEGAAELVARADSALYEAKALGRDRSATSTGAGRGPGLA